MADRGNKILAFGSNRSFTIEECQICRSTDLRSVLFLGYLPPVNTMPPIGTRPSEQPAYPAELLHCQKCQLFQLSCVVDPNILFPPSYPYTSGTTKILIENFAELYKEVSVRYPLAKEDLVVDLGSNDGTLLSSFHAAGHRVCGVEPTNAGLIARKNGITTVTSFFNRSAVKSVLKDHGTPKIVTAANVFAHIEDVHEVMGCILELLPENGLFISESHYLNSLLETLQYDTIYHEHLRYYSVTSLKYLFEANGLEILHVKRIPTHGGSIRVYASRTGKYPVDPSVAKVLQSEAKDFTPAALAEFKKRVVLSKLGLLSVLNKIRKDGGKVYGVGAPSRASTLINYVGLDDGILDAVLEISGSYKIGKYIPGTTIPVLDEAKLFSDQPEYALLLSWHIADELIPKLVKKGYKGKFIVPLPNPRIEG